MERINSSLAITYHVYQTDVSGENKIQFWTVPVKYRYSILHKVFVVFSLLIYSKLPQPEYREGTITIFESNCLLLPTCITNQK